jgi:addiction module HigA family antidote
MATKISRSSTNKIPEKNADVAVAYSPDYAIPPGASILEFIKEMGMTQADLARRMGRPPEQVNRLIKGHVSLEPDTALQLERTLGIKASFWLNLDAAYQEHKARGRLMARYSEWAEWARPFPLQHMAKQGYVSSSEPSAQTVKELLDYFGVVSPDQYRAVQEEWPIACRQARAFQRDEHAVSVWLRYGQRQAAEAAKKKFPAYNASAFKQALAEARTLTNQPFGKAMAQVRDLFRQAGVIFLFVEELPEIRLNGVVHWHGGRPIIQMTIRGKRADGIWFSLFHEAGHVLLHEENEVFLEGSGDRARFEAEADNFASDLLIPPKEAARIPDLSASLDEIKELAIKIGIAPGIVAGRILHDEPDEKKRKDGYRKFNPFRVPVEWEQVSSLISV